MPTETRYEGRDLPASSHPAVLRLYDEAKAYKTPDFLTKSPDYFRETSERDYFSDEKVPGKTEFRPELYEPGNPANHIYDGRIWVPKGNPEVVLPDAFDFENLKFFSPEKVEWLLEKLEHDARELKPGQKLAVVIGTGGTISMLEEDKKLVPKLDVEQILDFAGHHLKKEFKLSGLEFPRAIDSSQMYPDYIMDIVIAICAIYNQASDRVKENLSGFFITHGTDTMAWSASDMAMALGPKPPFSVGFAGAQTRVNQNYTDVGINVVDGLRALQDFEKNRLHSVFIAMGGSSGGAFTAVGSEKRSDTHVEAFHTPGHAKLIDWATFGEETGVRNHFLESFPPQSESKVFRPLVYKGYRPSFRISPESGSDPQGEYNRVFNSPEKVVVLESFGTGTAHRDIVMAVKEAAKQTDKVIFLASPLATGSLEHKYADALYAVEQGAIPVEMMRAAMTAKIHLGVTMLGTKDKKFFSEFVFNRNYVGEQFPKWRPRKPENEPLHKYIGAPPGFFDQEWEGKWAVGGK